MGDGATVVGGRIAASRRRERVSKLRMAGICGDEFLD